MIDPEDTVTHDLPQATRLRFSSFDRIYSVVLVEDLFDQWMVIQSWGGKNNLKGGGQITHVASFQDGLDLLQKITERREKRGYKLC